MRCFPIAVTVSVLITLVLDPTQVHTFDTLILARFERSMFPEHKDTRTVVLHLWTWSVSFPYTMATYLPQRKESFTGDLEIALNWIRQHYGVSMLTNQTWKVFNYFGTHSFFDADSKLSFYLILGNAPDTIDSKVFKLRSSFPVHHGTRNLPCQNIFINFKSA